MTISRRGWGWILVQLVIFALILWAPSGRLLPLPAPLRWAGLVLGSLGLALWRGSLTGLLLVLLLLVFFDRKSRHEERRLEARFPTYADYRRQVGKRLLPWIY